MVDSNGIHCFNFVLFMVVFADEMQSYNHMQRKPQLNTSMIQTFTCASKHLAKIQTHAFPSFARTVLQS